LTVAKKPKKENPKNLSLVAKKPKKKEEKRPQPAAHPPALQAEARGLQGSVTPEGPQNPS